MNALKKINARVKQLQKKHPGKKRKTLQKQAGAEYRAGKLKAKRKPAAKKVARKKTARKKTAVRKVARVASLGTIVKKRRKLKPRKVKVKAYRATRYKVSGMKSLTPVLMLGGLGILAYMLLKPATPAQQLYQSPYNQQRNTSANNILAYASAAGLTIAAITQLITALNAMSDDQVISASNNPASAVQQLTGPNATVYAPTGGPGITLNT